MSRRPSPFWLPTEALLLQGGDERIAPVSDGRNRYGCRPVPDGILAAFGSSTASSISEHAFGAADRLRRRWLADSLGRHIADLQRTEAVRIRAELTDLCGLSDIDGLEVTLAASGTDLHRLAASHGAGDGMVIMMQASETGSGVAAAIDRAPPTTQPHPRSAAQRPRQIAVRRLDGSPRPAAEIEAEIESLTAEAVAAGQRVLLVGLDLSKTGLVVPAPAFLAEWQQRWPGRVDVLIDACQFRLSTATLRRYLDEGFQVAVTGSKFFTGPSFCAALFMPPRTAESPPDRAAGRVLPSFGLMLRWEAALAEMRRWSEIPLPTVRRWVGAFAAAMDKRLSRDPAFERLPTPPPERGAFADPDGWDAIPTIFPFLLQQTGPDGVRRPLSCIETDALFRSLIRVGPDAAPGFQLGQPVRCGDRSGAPVSALRISLSARLVVEAAGSGRADAVVDRALAVLDRLARLLGHPSAQDALSRPLHHV